VKDGRSHTTVERTIALKIICNHDGIDLEISTVAARIVSD